jgi:hypothetical protein
MFWTPFLGPDRDLWARRQANNFAPPQTDILYFFRPRTEMENIIEGAWPNFGQFQEKNLPRVET